MAKKKSNNPLSRKTDWSINEFQMWLAGAYALQGDDWVPNPEQWELVVDIIYKLKDRGQAVRSATPQTMPVQQAPSRMPAPQQPVPQAPPSALNEVGGNPNPPFEPPPLPPEANMSLSALQAAAKAGGLSSGNKPIKTASIDTSKGYQGSFD